MVLRPRLIQRLNEGCKLTLISAPAGFGKTTLVSEWLTCCKTPAAWLSLDDGDNQPTRFLAYLVAALQTIAANIGTGVLSALQSPQPAPGELLLTSLLNEIAVLPDHFILVLDDYHVIDTQAVNQMLTFLVEHLTPQMRLVIATREDPHLPLARLRAQSQLTELRALDLRFTPAEAAEFLNQVMGLDLSAEDITALETRTEGWIAGLQMAALALQGIVTSQGSLSRHDQSDTIRFIQAFTGSHRFVLDYLIEEVLQRQPERVRSFLLQTAILERLCAPLCDSVTESEDSRGTLESLERSNLFVVPLDDRRQWYRYHHLFGDVLRVRLREEQPNQVSGLHRRASVWYEHNGLVSEAIYHALIAEDFERAAGLIELAFPGMDQSYQSATWLSWVKALPEEIIRVRPVLSVGYAWSLLDDGEMEICEERLRDAEKCLETAGNMQKGMVVTSNENATVPTPGMVFVDKEQLRTLPASIASARAYRALTLGDIPGAVKFASQALTLTPEEDQINHIQATSLLGIAQYASGDLEAADRSLTDLQAKMWKAGENSTATGISFILANIKIARGRLHEAASIYQQALQLAASRGEPMPVGMADLYRGLSELNCERGDLEAAVQHLQTSKKLGEQGVLTGWQHRLCVAEARIKEVQGDPDGALELLDKAERLYVKSPTPDVHPIAALRAQILIKQGRWSDALGWARQQKLFIDDQLSYLHEFEHIVLARLLIARYKHEHVDAAIHQAMELLERLRQAAEAGGRVGSLIGILVLQTLAHEAQDDIPSALEYLERALTLAEVEDYVRIFTAEGLSMAALLREAAKRGITPNYVSRLRAAFGQAKGRTTATQLLIEPLSERELEVLGLFRTELNGPEIARQLVVSLNTLRTHTKNIFTKLGVNNRRAAVRRAEELGLF